MNRVLRIVNKGFSEYFLFKGSKVLVVGGGIFLLGLMVVTTVTVIFRLINRVGFAVRTDWLVGGYEFSEMFMSMLTPFAMAYAWYTAGHVRIGLLRDRFGPRRKAAIDVVSAVLGAVFVFFVAWGVWELSETSFLLNRTSNLRDIPIGPFQVLFVVTIGHFLIVLLRSLVGLTAKMLGSRFANEPYLEGQ